MPDGEQGLKTDALFLPFLVDSETGEPLPTEVEVLVGWLSVLRKVPAAPTGKNFGGIEAMARVHIPLWVIGLGGKLALVDPLTQRTSKVEYKEPTRIDGFVERLQETHRKVSMFRNMLEAYQNTFPMSNAVMSVEVPGLVAGSEAALILRHAKRPTGSSHCEPAEPASLADTSYMTVKGAVSALQGVFTFLVEGLDELRLARSVLKVETESQLKSLSDEIGTLRAEYNQEIEATKDLANRTIQATARKRDDEIEIIASRFVEIKGMLISDLMNLKKAQSAIMREEGYLRKVAAASVANRLSPGSDTVRLLLGDHANRLRTVKDEASKIQVLVDEIDKEKGRELSAIKDLYDELIGAKSRVITDLEIELDVEVEKRVADVNELRELQESLERRIEEAIASNEKYIGKIDWLVPDCIGVKESIPLYVPVYLATSKRAEKPLLACSPGVLFSGAPPMGTAYALEERLKPISSHLRTLVELHLPLKAQKDQDFLRKTVQLVKSRDLLPEFAGLVSAGLKLAVERGWVGDSKARAIEAMAERPIAPST